MMYAVIGQLLVFTGLYQALACSVQGFMPMLHTMILYIVAKHDGN